MLKYSISKSIRAMKLRTDRKTGTGTEAELQKRVHGLLKTISKKYVIKWRWDSAGENIEGVNERSKLHQMNKNSRGYPDLTIYYNRRIFFLELKREGVNLASLLRANDAHIQEQFDLIKWFRKHGFCAAFAVGFHSAYQKIYAFIDNREIDIF
jgi:hypothetical protein